jgi:hypothetical protein
MDLTQKTKENRLRRAAARAGYRMTRSRRGLSLDNFGDYKLIDASTNFVAFGFRFDADLDDVDHFLHPRRKDSRKGHQERTPGKDTSQAPAVRTFWHEKRV